MFYLTFEPHVNAWKAMSVNKNTILNMLNLTQWISLKSAIKFRWAQEPQGFAAVFKWIATLYTRRVRDILP